MNLRLEQQRQPEDDSHWSPGFSGTGRGGLPDTRRDVRGTSSLAYGVRARHDGAREAASWLRRGLRHSSCPQSSLLSQGPWEEMPPRHVAPAESLQEGSSCPPPSCYQEGLGPLGAERGPALSRASCPVGSFACLPSALSRTLLPTLLTQGEERAQLQTVLPRDTVAADIAPSDDVENSSVVSTYFADLVERCWAGVICHLSPEEEQRKLETLDGLFEAHFSHNRC